MSISIRKKGENTASQIHSLVEEIQNQDAFVVEEQNEGYCDAVNLSFVLEDNEAGALSIEYLPPGVSKESHKKADLMCLILNKTRAVGKVFVYDIKHHFYNDDEIMRFVEQINSTYRDAKDLACSIQNNISLTDQIGVITADFDIERINAQRNYYQNLLSEPDKESKIQNAIKKHRSLTAFSIKRRSEVLSGICMRKIPLESGEDRTLHVIELAQNKDNRFEGSLVCQLH